MSSTDRVVPSSTTTRSVIGSWTPGSAAVVPRASTAVPWSSAWMWASALVPTRSAADRPSSRAAGSFTRSTVPTGSISSAGSGSSSTRGAAAAPGDGSPPGWSVRGGGDALTSGSLGAWRGCAIR